MTQPSSGPSSNVSTQMAGFVLIKGKLDKASSRGEWGHFWHGLSQSIGSALDSIKLSFKPELERMELKEKNIVEKMKKYGKTTRESLENRKVLISKALTDPAHTTDKKEITKLENQLRYLDSKLEKLSSQESQGALESKLEKVQWKIDEIKQGMITVDKRVNEMEKSVDAAVAKLRGLASDKDDIKVGDNKTQKELQGLDKLTQKEEVDLIKEMTGKIKRLNVLSEELKSDLKKDIKNDKVIKASIGLIDKNLHNATLLLKLSQDRIILQNTNDEDKKSSIKNEIRQIKSELDPEGLITQREHYLKGKVKLVEKALTFNVKVMDRMMASKEPIVKEYLVAYKQWRENPTDTNSIHNFLKIADQISGGQSRQMPTGVDNFLIVSIGTKLRDEIVGTATPLQHLNEFFNYAVELDLLRAADQEIKAMEAMVRPQKEPVLMEQIKDMQNHVNLLRKAFAHRGYMEVSDKVDQAREKLIQFANANDRLIRANPEMRKATNNLYKSIQDLHYDCAVKFNNDLRSSLIKQLDNMESGHLVVEVKLPPVKATPGGIPKPIIFGKGSTLDKKEQELLAARNADGKEMGGLKAKRDNIQNDIDTLRGKLATLPPDEVPSVNQVIEALNTDKKQIQNKINTLMAKHDAIEEELLEVQGKMLEETGSSKRPIEELLVEIGNFTDRCIARLQKNYDKGILPNEDIISNVDQLEDYLNTVKRDISSKQLKSHPEWKAKINLIKQQIEKGKLFKEYYTLVEQGGSDSDIEAAENAINTGVYKKDEIDKHVDSLKKLFKLNYTTDGSFRSTGLNFGTHVNTSPIKDFVDALLKWGENPRNHVNVIDLNVALVAVKTRYENEIRKQLIDPDHDFMKTLKSLSDLAIDSGLDRLEASIREDLSDSAYKLAGEMKFPKPELEGVYQLRDFISKIPAHLKKADDYRELVVMPLQSNEEYSQAAEKCDQAIHNLQTFEKDLLKLKDNKEVMAQFKEVSKDGTLETSKLYRDFENIIQDIKKKQHEWLIRKDSCLNNLKGQELALLEDVKSKTSNEKHMKKIADIEKEIKANKQQMNAVQKGITQPKTSVADIKQALDIIDDRISDNVKAYNEGAAEVKVVGPSKEIKDMKDYKLAIKDRNQTINQLRHAMEDLQTQFVNLNQLIASRTGLSSEDQKKYDKLLSLSKKTKLSSKDLKSLEALMALKAEKLKENQDLKELHTKCKKLEFELTHLQKIMLVEMKIELMGILKDLTLEKHRDQVEAQIKEINKKMDAIPEQALAA